MSAGQIILFLIISLIIFQIVRRFLLVRSITHYSSSDVFELMKNKSAILLDVRNKNERGLDNIRGSVHIPLQDIDSRSSELTKFLDKEIVCYCSTGSRSLSAAARLKKLGFKTANLKGGMLQWSAAGFK